MAEILEAYRELAVIMNEARPKPIRLEETSDNPPKRHGSPLFVRKELPVDLDGASEILCRFFETLSGSGRSDKQALHASWRVSRESPAWSEMVLRAVLSEDAAGLLGAAEQTGLEPQVLGFLGLTALSPFLDVLREAYAGRMADDEWGLGICPLCGSEPDMACFDKSGKRRLCCGFCGTEWSYPRRKCPFCANTDPETLGYFVDEEREALRVDFCETCTRYIKTVNAGLLEEPAPMEVERLASVYLDVLALEHGFTSTARGNRAFSTVC
jgi:FdhE protein